MKVQIHYDIHRKHTMLLHPTRGALKYNRNKWLRRLAARSNFGLLYGMGVKLHTEILKRNAQHG